MTVVMVEIRPKHPTPEPTPRAVLRVPEVVEADGVEVVANMDDYLEHAVCSCSAGDDNPY
jgi:hypothetical protein